MFKDNLRKARKHKDLTQKQLAKLLNVSDNAVSNWENGVSRPDIDQLALICTILSVSPNDLITAEVLTEILTPAEKEMLNKYNHLDDYGKKAVDSILDVEYERVSNSKQIKIAARNGSYEERTVTDSEEDEIEERLNGLVDVPE
jgi:transcriptional regulator with XRE-family HTH domain